MTAMLATSLPEGMKAIGREFQRGESLGSLLLTVVGIAAALALIFVMDAAVQRRGRRVERSRPKRLFRTLLVQLQLTVPERDLLLSLADDLGLEHPTLILLCPQIYREHADRWCRQAPQRSPGAAARFDAIARRLFVQTE